MTARRPGAGAAAALALMAGAALSALPACSTQPRQGQLSHDGDPAADLRRLSIEQQSAPDAQAQRAVAAGEPSAARRELSEDERRRAELSLGEAIAESAQSIEQVSRPAPERKFSPAATSLYARGKLKMLSGDLNGAAADLDAATRADPGSPEPWRALALVQWAGGDRTGAVVSMRAAVQRGLDDPVVFTRLGLAELEQSRFAEAAAVLARAAETPVEIDGGARFVASAGLGRALLSLGYLRAGVQAAQMGLELPEQLAAPTNFVDELNELVRRRGEINRQMADALTQLGDYAAAAVLYASAVDTGGQSASSRVSALMRAGRSADAALVVLDELNAGGQRSPDSAAELVRLVAQSDAVRPALAASLAERARSASSSSSPTIAAALLRLQAIAEPPDRARAVLRDLLAARPGDRAAAIAIVRSLDPADAARIGDVVSDLVAQSPLAADACAEAILAIPDRAGAVLDELAQRLNPAAQLVLARVWLLTERPTRAWDVASRIALDRASDELRTAVLVARGQSAAARGDAQSAGESVDALAGMNTADAALGAARVTAALQRPAQALELARPFADAADASIDTLLEAAELAIAARRGEDAQRWLLRARERDAADPRPLQGLVALHAPSAGMASLMPDAGKFQGALRSLRELDPSSRWIRSVRAAEAVQRGAAGDAVAESIELLREDPTDRAAAELLARTAESAEAQVGATAPAIARVRAVLAEVSARHPLLPWLAAAHARAAAAGGEAAEAVRILENQADTTASEPVLRARVIELIVRARLNDAARADALLRARTESTPRPIDATIERAQLLSRSEGLPAAERVLVSDVWPDVSLSEDQVQRVLEALRAAAAGEAASGRQPLRADSPEIDRAAAAGIIGWLVDRGARVGWTVHGLRLQLLATLPASSPDTHRSAVDAAARESPEQESAANLVMMQGLASAERFAEALPFIVRAVQTSAGAPESELLRAWFQLVAEAGTEADAEAMLTYLQRTGRAAEFLADLLRREPPQLPVDPRSEIAFQLAGLASYRGVRGEGPRSAEATQQAELVAIAFYRMALRLDARHWWAANNLAYSLIERGESIEEAAKLAESAYAALPQEASITDTLGWLRYRQGRLTDETNAETGVVVPGAVTLLEKAAALERGSGNATMLDHLGDALWRLGVEHRERAADLWRQAELRALERLAESRVRSSPVDLEYHTKRLQGVRAKLEAIAGGLESAQPPVAPLFQRSE